MKPISIQKGNKRLAICYHMDLFSAAMSSFVRDYEWRRNGLMQEILPDDWYWSYPQTGIDLARYIGNRFQAGVLARMPVDVSGCRAEVIRYNSIQKLQRKLMQLI